MTVPRRHFCCGFLLPVFGVRGSVTFHLMFVHTCTISSVWVAERPSFAKELLTRLTICSFCIFTICNFSYFPFCEGGLWVLIVPVPGHCIHVTSINALS